MQQSQNPYSWGTLKSDDSMFLYFLKLTSNRIQIPLHSKLVTFLGKWIIMETKANDLSVTVRKLLIVDWKNGTLQNFQSLRLNQLSPSCPVSAHFQPFSLCFISCTVTVQLRCGLEPWHLCPAGDRALLSWALAGSLWEIRLCPLLSLPECCRAPPSTVSAFQHGLQCKQHGNPGTDLAWAWPLAGVVSHTGPAFDQLLICL